MSATLTRIFIIVGATVGPTASVFFALIKLAPERAKMILGYQVEAITSLQAENKRLSEIVARLERRVEELEQNS